MTAALLWKEWREQRWRLLLGAFVLATISASLVRAQLMMLSEAAITVFWPLGLLLAVFLAMGSVATERADGTWPFLCAQPIGRARVLRIKWLMGAIFLLVSLLAAGLAAYVAARSRGLFDLPLPPPGSFSYNMLRSGHLAGWLWSVVGLSAVGLLGWYTTLFFILTRARSELHAGIGGLLLTVAAVAWVLQYWITKVEDLVGDDLRRVLWVGGTLSPLSPLPSIFEQAGYRLLTVAIALLLWTLGPLWLAGRLERKGWYS